MNPDDRLGEAVKQAEIAQDAAITDDYAERMLGNAADLLERTQRRLKRRRLERERVQEASADGG